MHGQKEVIGGSEAWKVSVQSGLLQKMMLENFLKGGSGWNRGAMCGVLG